MLNKIEHVNENENEKQANQTNESGKNVTDKTHVTGKTHTSPTSA